jgi:hypothetical protein
VEFEAADSAAGIDVAATSSFMSFEDAALDFLVFFACGASIATGVAAMDERSANETGAGW